MGGEPLPGSTSPSTLARKRSFSEVDGCVQEANPQDNKEVTGLPEGITPNDGFQVSTATHEIQPSIETAGVPQSTTTTKSSSASTSTASLSVDSLPHADRIGSPDPSILSPIPLPNSISNIQNQRQTSPPQPATPPPTSGFILPNNNKKRKLSSASKQARALEREMKEKQRAEEKAKRDEERRKREEERKKKDEEKKKRDEEREEERRKREEKKKAKDEERLAREEEKKKRDEERIKKEKSQMRLNAFFAKPTASNSTSTIDAVEGGNSASVNDSSGGSAATKSEQKPFSDYEQEFPPFFLQSHVKLAPPHRFERDADSLKYACEKLDSFFKKATSSEEEAPAMKFRPSELFDMLPYRRRQGRPNGPTVREILLMMQDVALNTMDLTGDKETPNPGDLLEKIPMKVLKFGEDVRPPYQGTFTKRLPEQEARRLCRNPFGRIVPDFNYNYDSEAEWEEPEEGEDLDSEVEEEMSEGGDGDMEDFLDDGDDDVVGGRRRVIVGDLEPVCSGIHWEGEGDIDPMMSSCRMEVISETINFPIDPFSSVYWSKPSPASRSPLKHLTHRSNQPLDRAGAMTNYLSQKQSSQSSRLLQPSSTLPSTLTTTLPSGQSALLPVAASNQKPRRPFPPDQVAEFKEVIDGSNLTKAGLIEVLKKRFPKVSKDIIKDTLTSTAQRLGQKEADKKWVLI
ncbi:hypothetical protein ACJ73_04999 [Blastomyces percursus]|uniref:Chromatin assembly factor 1 subunit A n=1 Tax=Blastomyces percursus TaxID=1658174 RepID=A0A1J9R568_9EURO|nr:hypothetical protein ACJ73_04999 [Blastomyces percursus]